MRTEPAGRTRFPVGLTLAAAVGLAILVALGMWQLQRLTWKEALLARIAKLETAAPMPVATALDGAASPADLDMIREECCGALYRSDSVVDWQGGYYYVRARHAF